MESFSQQSQPVNQQQQQEPRPALQRFPSQYSTTSTNTVGRSTSASNFLPGPQTTFQTFDDFEFYRAGTTSYRVSVNTIEQIPYVAISHWWFNQAQATWFPSRKQIFLPKAAWLNLISQADRPSQVIRTFGDGETSPGNLCNRNF